MDVAATLEYLETLSVPVAVWRSDSGVEVEWRVDEAQQLADAFRAGQRLGWEGGMLLGVPIPTKYALEEQTTRKAVNYALAELKRRGVTGKETTPFLLQAIFEYTDRASLAANTALIQHNAGVGAELAVSLNNG